MGMLLEMHVWLSELETEELYHALPTYFGLAGALNEYQALETAWKEPYNVQIEKFPMLDLRKSTERRKKPSPVSFKGVFERHGKKKRITKGVKLIDKV